MYDFDVLVALHSDFFGCIFLAINPPGIKDYYTAVLRSVGWLPNERLSRSETPGRYAVGHGSNENPVKPADTVPQTLSRLSIVNWTEVFIYLSTYGMSKETERHGSLAAESVCRPPQQQPSRPYSTARPFRNLCVAGSRIWFCVLTPFAHANSHKQVEAIANMG